LVRKMLKSRTKVRKCHYL